MAEKATSDVKKGAERKKIRKVGRAKRKTKLAGDKEFAKAFFEAKSKRAADKKTAFRKKKKGK